MLGLLADCHTVAALWMGVANVVLEGRSTGECGGGIFGISKVLCESAVGGDLEGKPD